MLKKIIATLSLALLAASPLSAAVVVGPDGVIRSNVCRSGLYFFVFNNQFAPIGTPCWFDLPLGPGGTLTRFFGNMSAE